jgi:HD-GYP domain-containing protein (c-di-GMP phosphodiesterase class II)
MQNLTKVFANLARSAASNATVRDPSGRIEKLALPPDVVGQIHVVAADVDVLLDQLSTQEVLLGLNSIKSHDNYTYQHSIDVTVMGIVLARAAGWDRQRVRAFGIGCILHDIGKTLINPRILNKDGPLTDDEFDLVKQHPVTGYELIKTTAPSLGHLVPQVALQHHERQDGSGYPRGLRGNNRLGRQVNAEIPNMIHDFGALSAVADVYDALISDRPYRRGYAPDRVYDAIRRMSGMHLNAEAVAVFRKVVTPYPVCCEVRVLNGRYAGWNGVVARVPAQELDRPVIRLLSDGADAPVEPVEVDLLVEGDVEVELKQMDARGPLALERAGRQIAPPLPQAVRETLSQLRLAPAWDE